MALFVLEGLDRTGKSTLARELSEYLEKTTGKLSDIAHFSAPKTDRPVDEYMEPLLDYVPGGHHHLIYDRAFLGEAVWPAIFERRPGLTESEYRLLVHAFRSSGALFVLCRRDLEEVKRAVDAENEPLSSEDVDEAFEMFRRQFEWLTWCSVSSATYDRSTARRSDQLWLVDYAMKLDAEARDRRLGALTQQPSLDFQLDFLSFRRIP